MSDGVGKPSDELPVDTVVKRVGRVRICKECRFTTTDVREFSNHRLHAHAEQTEESSVTKKGSLRRKTSLTSCVGEVDTTEQNSEQTTCKDPEQNINKDAEQNTSLDIEQKPGKVNEQVSKTSIPNIDRNKCDTGLKMEDGKSEQHVLVECEQTPEQTISDELLSSLSLKKLTKKPEMEKAKPETMENGLSDREKGSARWTRPATEKFVIDRPNGHTEEVLLVNNDYDQDQDDEPRLVIADEGSEFDDGIENPDSESPALTRTGNIQNRTYICNVCDYSTTSAKSYLHHQKDFHYLDIIIYECDICEYATKYKQKLPRHRKLHFTGKDGLLSESDLDLSLTEREMKEMRERPTTVEHMTNGEDEMDDEGEVEEDDEEELVPSMRLDSSHLGEMPSVEVKKKRVRQEVDPLKYYEVVDDNGVKYACSKCGNVYKWRKSLNKHWKEKHFGEVPDLTKPPPTLQNYTLFSRFKSKFGGQGNPPAAPNVVYGAAVPSPSSQANKNNNNSSSGSKPDDNKQPANPPVIMPKFIGPFIGGTSPSSLVQGGLLSQPPQLTPERQKEIRQMMAAIQNQSRLEHRQLDHTRMEQVRLIQNTINNSTEAFQRNPETTADDQPLDFSKKKETIQLRPERVEIKPEPYWGSVSGELNSLHDRPIFSMMSPPTSHTAGDVHKQQQVQQQQVAMMAENPVLQCTKCSFVAKTLVDYSSHMSLHLNKRAFKCAECQAHFNGVEDLNKHFAELHSEKIHEHKEAIQKIPHGLQQTYHLLKMPLDSISNLSSQDILSNEPKQLKCNMCQFVAKWPAELQKHAVSHSEERPFICMVCGSTYKWKWDLVKHFEKSHSTLPNPYKRRDGVGPSPKGMYDDSSSTPPPIMSKTAAALIDASITGVNYVMTDEDPPSKKRRMSDSEMQENANIVLKQFQQAVANKYDALSSMTETIHVPDRPSSDPSEPRIFENQHEQISFESTTMEDQKFDQSAKLNRQKQVADALKNRIASGGLVQETPPKDLDGKVVKTTLPDVLLPYKCTICEYRARWPSEISQHMKNHSNEKPFHCPRCSYKSKWKWDVVKHLRRCGGGTVHDVIDTTKTMKRIAPPNVTVMPHGNMQQGSSQPVFPGNRPVTPTTSCSPNSIQTSFPSASPAKFTTDFESLDLTNSSYATEQMSPIHKQPVFRSLINQGLYHCLECPFVGNSTAELRRHAVLHSENKPFVCSQCGYSSRWKSDLKKHLKTYNHISTISPSPDGDSDDAENMPYTEMEEESDDDEQRSTLYMCPKCPYNSYKRHAYELHLQIHGDQMEEAVEPTVPTPTSSCSPSTAKFKCSKCDYYSNDLSSFLQHKMEHSKEQSSSVSKLSFSPVNISTSASEPASQSADVSNRTFHLKHRRKPIKQFRCPKCPYVCFKRTGFTLHESMHEPRGTEAYLCMFCDYNVFSKSLVLQHMRLHPEYNPSECVDIGQVGSSELQQIEEMEEQESANNTRKVLEENNNEGEYESGLESGDATMKFSKPSTPQIKSTAMSAAQLFSNLKRQSAALEVNNNDKDDNGLPCEWCTETFPNVVTLYHHCQKDHPTQLKAQEAGDIAAKQSPARQSQLEQIVKERQRDYMVYHQFMSRQQPQIQQQIQIHLQNQTQGLAAARRLIPLAPKVPTSPVQQRTSPIPALNSSSTSQEYASSLNQSQLSPGQLAALKARRSTSRQNRSRSFQCTKCSFTAPNAVTYLRHIERHGSNCKHTCLYCDYSIDRLNLLYQHMKGTHSNLWQGTAEEKIHLSVNGDDNNNIIGMPRESPTDSIYMSDSEDLNASFNSSFNESNDGEAEMRSGFDGGILSLFQSKGIKPVLIVKDEIQWRGIPVQVCTLDGKKHYKCPWCLYISSNAANTTNHVRQHDSNRKYTCTHCNYSVDNIKIIQHHIETVHPKDPNFIQVINQPYSVSEPSTGQADIEDNNDLAQCNSKPDSTVTGHKSDVSSSPGENSNVDVFECPKCPYKTQEKRRLQSHLERHVYRGKYACQLCDYSVDKYNFLRVHARLHNKTIQSGSNMAMDVDDDDGEWFENNIPSDLRPTMLDLPDDTSGAKLMEEILGKLRKTNGQVQFKCSCCPYHTLKKSNIVSHRNYHVNKSRFSCHLCTFSASQTFLLNQHMTFHEQMQQVGTCMNTNSDNEIVVDPYNETLAKLMQQLPTDDDGDVGEMSGMEEDVEFQKGMDVYDGEDYGIDSDGDAEAAMMEQELRDSMVDPKSSMGVEKNLNSEFDREIQFRNYKCQECPFSSNSNTEFRKHGRLHGMNLKFKCDYCSYCLDRVNLLQQHRKLHFQEPDFNLAPLTSQLLNRDHEEYELNLAKVGNEIAFPPSDSGSRTDDKMSEFGNTQQKTLINITSLEDKIRYMCNKCPYRCNALKSFKCHIQMHGLSRKYKCDYCNWSADRLNLLYQHRKVHAFEPEFNPNPGEIAFLNREYALGSSAIGSSRVGLALEQHSENPFEGGDLQKFTGGNDNYLSPQKTVDGQKIHYCKLCPFMTDSNNNYSYHKKLHCIQARYTCSECSFSINNWTSLSEHIKLHKKERKMLKATIYDSKVSHKCPKCPYSSPTKNLLAGHTTMHASGRKHECTKCDFSVDKHDLLVLHAKVHMDGYKPADSLEELELAMKRTPDVIGPEVYFTAPVIMDMDTDSNGSSGPEHKCDKCPYSTPSKDELGDHVANHNNLGKNRCMYCTFSCGKEDHLVEHTQLHFPSERLDKEILRIMKRQRDGYQRNITKAFDDPKEGDSRLSEDEVGEPDSTVTESPKLEGSQKVVDTEGAGHSKDEQGQEIKETESKTKVYVCQYCEREFDSKPSMLQHEKQHLVGYQL